MADLNRSRRRRSSQDRRAGPDTGQQQAQVSQALQYGMQAGRGPASLLSEGMFKKKKTITLGKNRYNDLVDKFDRAAAITDPQQRLTQVNQLIGEVDAYLGGKEKEKSKSGKFGEATGMLEVLRKEKEDITSYEPLRHLLPGYDSETDMENKYRLLKKLRKELTDYTAGESFGRRSQDDRIELTTMLESVSDNLKRLQMPQLEGFGSHHSGYMMKKDTEKMPGEGWKMHVTADPMTAAQILPGVVDYMARRGDNINYKYITDVDNLDGEVNRSSRDPDQHKKFIAIYPASKRQAREIAKYIDHLFKTEFPTLPPNPIRSETQVGESGHVYARYGSYNGKKIKANPDNPDDTALIPDPMGKLPPHILAWEDDTDLDRPFPHYFIKDPGGKYERIFDFEAHKRMIAGPGAAREDTDRTREHTTTSSPDGAVPQSSMASDTSPPTETGRRSPLLTHALAEADNPGDV